MMQDPIKPEEITFEAVRVSIDDAIFDGVLIDWALAMASPTIKVFNMHDGSYPGNYNKLTYAMDNPTVIVDLLWYVWFEHGEKSCSYNPHENWEFLGPFLTGNEKPVIRYDFTNNVYAVYFQDDHSGTYLVCHEKLETAVAKAFLIFKLGTTIVVPKPLIDRYVKQ